MVKAPLIETSDGIKVFHQDWGTGKTIVFVHSWMFDSNMWQYNVADFSARGYRCVAFDRRGHGRSDRASHGYVLERLVDDLATVLEWLDLRDVTLVGHSLGGAEVIGYLARHGTSRVARAVLLAAGTPFMLRTDDNPNGFDPEMVAMVRAAWAKDFPKWAIDSAEAFYRPNALAVHRGIIDWTIDMMVSIPIQVAVQCNRVLIEADQRAAMKKLELPMLVIHGDADASIPVHFGRMSAQLLRASEYVEYKGAPHGLFFTHRESILRDVVRFIEQR